MKPKFHLLIGFLIALNLINVFSCQASYVHFRPNLPGLVRWVDPEYPAALRHRGITGRGIFLLRIDSKTGDVIEVKVIKSTGYTVLNELAAKGFLQCKFQPGGRTEMKIPYEFWSHGYARQVH
jgi:TonB family protein